MRRTPQAYPAACLRSAGELVRRQRTTGKVRRRLDGKRHARGKNALFTTAPALIKVHARWGPSPASNLASPGPIRCGGSRLRILLRDFPDLEARPPRPVTKSEHCSLLLSDQDSDSLVASMSSHKQALRSVPKSERRRKTAPGRDGTSEVVPRQLRGGRGRAQAKRVMKAEELHTAHHRAGHFVVHRHIRVRDPHFQGGSAFDAKTATRGRDLPLHGMDYRRRQATLDDRAAAERRGADAAVFPESDTQDVKNYVVYLYAGAAAELKFDRSRAKEVRISASRDDEKARKLLEELRRPDLEAELRASAAGLVRQHWSEVRYLAIELLRYKTLGSEEAELVCNVATAVQALATYRSSHRRGRR